MTDLPNNDAVDALPPTAEAPSSAHNPQRARSGAVVLLVLALIIVAGLGFYVGRATAPQTSTQAAPTTQDVATDSAGSETADEAEAVPEDYAPSQTSEDALEILRSFPRRDAEDARAVGDVNAPVVMSEFADFSCPMCTRHATEVHPELQALVDQGILRIEFNDLVIFSDYGSDLAAAGGLAAAEQGKFWEYYDTLFQSAGAGAHPTYTVESLTEMAKEAGVPDLDAFAAKVQSEEVLAELQASTADLYGYGITGTPFFMINDAVISGAYPLEYIQETVLRQAALVQNQG